MKAYHNIKLEASPVFAKNWQAVKSRITVNQGGTRSGKTYALCQLFALMMMSQQGQILTIARQHQATARATVVRDFLQVMQAMGLHKEEYYKKVDLEYHFNGNVLEFIGTDQPQKIRGRKRHYLWLNEANEISYDSWKQLIFRTTGRIWLDYNPSEEYHWIYDKVIPRKDATFIQSTYKDNPFLPAELVAEIERLQTEDPTYWQIYGLGEKAVSQAIIYPKWDTFNEPNQGYHDRIFALDFGFNNPSVLLELRLVDGLHCYVYERVYSSKLTNSQLIQACAPYLDKRTPIYADSAEADRIEEFSLAGYNIHPATKDVHKGIDTVKTFRLHIDSQAGNTIKEIKSYKWKEDRDGRVLDQPVKLNDHAMDALRYGLHTHHKSQQRAIKPKAIKVNI